MTQRDERRTAMDRARATLDIVTGLAYYDSLPAVTVAEMLGAWRGGEWPTGHPMDGLLERFGWHGKRFASADDVQPLLFATGRGLVAVNARWLPVRMLLRCPALFHAPATDRLFRAVRPLMTTRHPGARLRMTEYRGVVTATTCYDSQPIHDAFRRVDEDTVLGAMELRGSPHPFLFVLTRERAH